MWYFANRKLQTWAKVIALPLLAGSKTRIKAFLSLNCHLFVLISSVGKKHNSNLHYVCAKVKQKQTIKGSACLFTRKGIDAVKPDRADLDTPQTQIRQIFLYINIILAKGQRGRKTKNNAAEHFPQYTNFYWHVKAYGTLYTSFIVCTKKKIMNVTHVEKYASTSIEICTVCKTYGITNERHGVGEGDRWETRATRRAVKILPDIHSPSVSCWERRGQIHFSSVHRTSTITPQHRTTRIWSAFMLHYSVEALT